MTKLQEILREIHRRSLWQVLGVYVASSWMVLQVVEVLTDTAGLPDWVGPASLVLLLLGLPIVLATAIVQRGVGRGDALPGEGSAGERSGGAVAPGAAGGRSDQREPAAAAADFRRPRAGSVEASGTHHRLFTWRNALMGGGLAFAGLAVVTALWLGARSLGIGPAGTLVAKGILEARAPVLVADFATPSEDVALARAATEAFRIDLAQSDVVTVVERVQVADALRRMERPADATLDPELAREVALREGIPAIVAGEIGAVGGGYQLSARILRAEDGTVLVSHRETAAGQEDVIDAIDRLSKRLRERVGESLRSLQREEPLAQVTTGSLDALRLYSRALAALDRESDEDRAIALLEEAVERDSAFAMAWRKLGVILGNRFEQRTRQVEALTRAFEHRDRLTERERRHAAAMYHYQVAGQPARAADELESLLERYPEDDYALNNLGVMRGFLRDHAAAESLYVAAFGVDSMSAIAYTNAAQEQFAQGKVEEARETLNLFDRRFPDNMRTSAFRGALAAATGEWDAARTHFETFHSRAAESLYLRREANQDLAAIAALRGRLEEAERLFERAARLDRERGVPSAALELAADKAEIDHWVRGDSERARERLAEAVAGLEELEPLARPYLRVAASLAIVGDPGTARELVRRFEDETPAEIRSWLERSNLQWAKGEIALAEGRPDEAAEAFHRSDVGFCEICAQEALGRAHETAGRADSAIAAYERYLETPWLWRHEMLDFSVRGPILERLGRLHEGRGEPREAVRYYAELAELWKDADPVLQPRVEAARQRLEEILATTG